MKNKVIALKELGAKVCGLSVDDFKGNNVSDVIEEITEQYEAAGGEQGAAGKDGADGQDGVGIESITADLDDNTLTFEFAMTDGSKKPVSVELPQQQE